MKQSVETTDRLLQSGHKLFARKGFDAATVREITRDARANLGAITYHFGSKLALYHAVLEAVFDDLAGRIERAAATPGSAADRLRAVVDALFAFFADHPEVPRLVIRELARPDAPPPAPVVPGMRRILGAIGGVVEDGQRAGTIRPVAPALATFSLISQCVWFAVVGHQLPAVMGLATEGSAFRDRMRAHIADVVVRALATEGS